MMMFSVRLLRIPNKLKATHLEALKHPAYSLDFLSCHFHIFGPIKKAFKGCTFTADSDVK
jgi:hypothetical protein